VLLLSAEVTELKKQMTDLLVSKKRKDSTPRRQKKVKRVKARTSMVNESKIAIYRYTNDHSSQNSSQRDWDIGVAAGCVGRSNSVTSETEVFVIIETRNEADSLLGYCGKTRERVRDVQPWHVGGGREWKYVHKVDQHVLLGKLQEVCRDARVNDQIFKRSAKIGHPKNEDKEDFAKLLRYVHHVPQSQIDEEEKVACATLDVNATRDEIANLSNVNIACEVSTSLTPDLIKVDLHTLTNEWKAYASKRKPNPLADITIQKYVAPLRKFFPDRFGIDVKKWLVLDKELLEASNKENRENKSDHGTTRAAWKSFRRFLRQYVNKI
jgi:hypothetical protein